MKQELISKQTGLGVSSALEMLNFRHPPDTLGRRQLVKLGLALGVGVDSESEMQMWAPSAYKWSLKPRKGVKLTRSESRGRKRKRPWTEPCGVSKLNVWASKRLIPALCGRRASSEPTPSSPWPWGWSSPRQLQDSLSQILPSGVCRLWSKPRCLE